MCKKTITAFFWKANLKTINPRRNNGVTLGNFVQALEFRT